MSEHTCWNVEGYDFKEWAGTVAPIGTCAACDEARQNRCEWCGFGHLFPTHNPLAHAEGGDPLTLMEDDFPEALWGVPDLRVRS